MRNLQPQLINRLQNGDPAAAAELVAAFEPEIRRYIRVRMCSPQMRRLVESVDISQSVFAKFFVDVQREGNCPETPEQLRRLLITMARNKICDHVRRNKAAKRDIRRVDTGNAALETASYEDPTPSEYLGTREILDAVRAELSDDELALVNARLSGQGWSEIAAELGISPDAARKRHRRIIESMAQHFEGLAR
ncbi:MAG: sigma-70 family RNA polymerase sigma factor [Planctomycetales bacterium]|nr:sigma-70 family RNA polymerase sigma factor [Planctomycetales bacterium]